MVRSRISPPSVRTDPPGWSSDERRTASATWSNVSPCRRRSFSETSIEISYGGALTMSTCVIPGDRRQLVGHPLGDLFQRERVHVAGHRDVDNLQPVRQPADDRLLGLERERGDGVDGPEVELDRHRAHPLVRRRADLLDAVDALDRLLDADGHRRLDLLGGGAEIQDLDADRSSSCARAVGLAGRRQSCVQAAAAKLGKSIPSTPSALQTYSPSSPRRFTRG